MAKDKEAAGNAQQQSMNFETRKVYLKDASFEAPSTPHVFTQTDLKPKIDVQVLVEYRILDKEEGMTEIVLKVTVTAKHEENVLYLAEVHQAGLFKVQHPDEEMRKVVTEVTCPHILLPFAREELNNLISKGGFGSFLMAPVNFETIYRNKVEKDMDQAATTDSPKTMN